MTENLVETDLAEDDLSENDLAENDLAENILAEDLLAENDSIANVLEEKIKGTTNVKFVLIRI